MEVVIAHKSIKNEDGSRMYECLFPGCSYKTKFGNMAKHKTVHKPRNAKNLLQCTAVGCTYETKWICYYRKHLKLHDPNRQRNQECPLCPKKFWSAVDLKRHIKRHTAEKPHKCQYCDYATVECGNLYYHRRKHHSKLLLKPPAENNSSAVTTELRKTFEFKQSAELQFPSCVVKAVPVVTLHRIVISM